MEKKEKKQEQEDETGKEKVARSLVCATGGDYTDYTEAT